MEQSVVLASVNRILFDFSAFFSITCHNLKYNNLQQIVFRFQIDHAFALISREEKQAQILVEKWSKKRKKE